MKPLIVLLTAFVIALFAMKIISQNYDIALSGRIAMSAMLLFTAISHFIYTKGMTLMIPRFFPFKKELVYITGIIEIAGPIGLLIPNLKLPTA